MSHTGTVKWVFLNKRAQSRLSMDNDSIMSDDGESDEQVINKINYCIVLFLRHVQWLHHFSKIQLSTANLICTRL